LSEKNRGKKGEKEREKGKDETDSFDVGKREREEEFQRNSSGMSIIEWKKKWHYYGEGKKEGKKESPYNSARRGILLHPTVNRGGKKKKGPP